MCEHAWFWLWAVVCGGDSSAALIFVLLMYDRSRFLLSDCLLCSSRSAQVCATNIKLRSFNLSAIGSTLTCRTDVWTRLMDCLRCSSRSAQVCAANAKLRPFSQSAIRSTLTRWTDVRTRLILILCCFCGVDSSAALNFVLLMYDRSRFQLMDCLLCSSKSAQVCAANIKLWSFN